MNSGLPSADRMIRCADDVVEVDVAEELIRDAPGIGIGQRGQDDPPLARTGRPIRLGVRGARAGRRTGS